MSRFYEENLWADTWPHKEYIYCGKGDNPPPSMDDDDEDIERFIEQSRLAYYREWFSYMKEFEEC